MLLLTIVTTQYITVYRVFTSSLRDGHIGPRYILFSMTFLLMTHPKMWQEQIVMLLLIRLVSAYNKSFYIWSGNQGFLNGLLIPSKNICKLDERIWESDTMHLSHLTSLSYLILSHYHHLGVLLKGDPRALQGIQLPSWEFWSIEVRVSWWDLSVTSRIVNWFLQKITQHNWLLKQINFIQFILLREDTILTVLIILRRNWLVMEDINTSLSMFPSDLRFQGKKLVVIRPSQRYNSIKLIDTMRWG